MFIRKLAAVAAFVGAFATASAQSGLQITDPSSSLWWVAGSVNTLAWTCNTSPYSSYTVVVSQSGSSPLALLANLENYDCSESINAQLSSLQVGTNWTLSLTNPQNMSDIYASTEFEIKAYGSAYPTSSSAAPSGTSTASGSTTTGSKTGGAVSNFAPVGLSMAAALVGFIVA